MKIILHHVWASRLNPKDPSTQLNWTLLWYIHEHSYGSLTGKTVMQTLWFWLPKILLTVYEICWLCVQGSDIGWRISIKMCTVGTTQCRHTTAPQRRWCATKRDTRQCYQPSQRDIHLNLQEHSVPTITTHLTEVAFTLFSSNTFTKNTLASSSS